MLIQKTFFVPFSAGGKEKHGACFRSGFAETEERLELSRNAG